MLTGQAVDESTVGALGENRSVQTDQTLQNTRVGLDLSVGGLAEVECASNIGGSVVVLRTRIAKVNRIGIDDGACVMLGLVVHDCSTVTIVNVMLCAEQV